jgi:hypothetical protein
VPVSGRAAEADEANVFEKDLAQAWQKNSYDGILPPDAVQFYAPSGGDLACLGRDRENGPRWAWNLGWRTVALAREYTDMRVEVECYAGRKADERPVRFRLDQHEYIVTEVLDTWHSPDHVFFKVRADDDCLYILRHETSVPDGDWDLVSFREPGRG